MLRGPKGLTPWVDLRCHQYPENGLLAGLGWGFHPKITLWSQQKQGKKLFFIYVKRGKAKNNVISYLGVPWVRNDQCKQFKWGFTPDSNPKRGNTRTCNKIDINLCESAKAKKNRVIAYLIVFSEYGMTNASISSVALPLAATQKWVKRG